MHFRFARYNGKNYDEVVSYLSPMLSKNSSVWPEEELDKGTWYGYSGKTLLFQRIPLSDLRICIVNNPMILIEEKAIPLYFSYQEAKEYLHGSNLARVFSPDDVLNTYLYDTESRCYKLVNRSHKDGLIMMDLPVHDKWFIGCNDHIQDRNITVSNSENQIHTSENIREKVDSIMNGIDIVNSLSDMYQKDDVIFSHTWEFFKRYQSLYDTCLTNSDFWRFISALWEIVYEETKDGLQGKRLGRLPEPFQRDYFVIAINELRCYFGAHGRQEMYLPKIDISEVFLHYTGVNRIRQPQDYLDLQLAILSEFEDFVERIKTWIEKAETIKDVISIDGDGNVFCNKVLLIKDLAPFVGFVCTINGENIELINNPDFSYKYKFTCMKDFCIDIPPQKVELQKDINNCFYHVDSILLENGQGLEGFSVCINSMRLLYTKLRNNTGFRFIAREYSIVDIPDQLKKELASGDGHSVQVCFIAKLKRVGRILVCGPIVIPNKIYNNNDGSPSIITEDSVIQIRALSLNDNIYTSKEYPYFAKKIKILNKN